MAMKHPPLVWTTVRKKIDDLVPYSGNPRVITDQQMEDLKRSLKRYNVVELAAIDVDGTIIAGNQRLRALQLLGRGQEMVEVRQPNRKLTKTEFEGYLIGSNSLGGTWDWQKLKSFDFGTLLDLGFGETELASVWDQTLSAEDDSFDVEKELAAIRKPKTRIGDLFALGSHKIIAGDATDPAILKRLFGKDRASMVYSDPIYNIGIEYNKGLGGKQNYGGNVIDRRSDADYKTFLKKSMENALAVSKDDVHFFYWCDESYVWLIQQLYRELGIANKRICLWVKNGAYPTPGVAFSKCIEPAVYGVRGKPYLAAGVNNLNEIMNRELGSGNRLVDDILDYLNIWLVKRLSGDQYEHATSKPPSLHEKAIRRCTRPGDIILDSFLGSGSTLISVEQLKRRVYGCELEPTYCDLIIRRYEKLTGHKAKKLN